MRRYYRRVDSGVIVVGAILVAAVVRVAYRGLFGDDARIRRALGRRPSVRISDAKDGEVRLTGTIHPAGELLHAPVTQRPCAGYKVIVEVRATDGWERVIDLEDARPFKLVDESGEALVDTAAGPFALALVPDRRGTNPVRQSAEGGDIRAVRSLLNSADIATTDLMDSPKKFRYREAVLLPGRRASVGGIGAREVTPDGQRTGRREPPQRFVVRGTADSPLLVSDRGDAGPGRPGPFRK